MTVLRLLLTRRNLTTWIPVGICLAALIVEPFSLPITVALLFLAFCGMIVGYIDLRREYRRITAEADALMRKWEERRRD